MPTSIRNILSNYGLVALRGAVLIALTPLMLRTLGIEGYAGWIILNSIAYYLGFFDLGLSDAQVRQHGILADQKNSRAIQQLHSTVLSIFIAAGVVGILVSMLLGLLPIADWLGLPKELATQLPVLLILLGVLNLARFIEQAIEGIYEGEERFDLLNGLSACAVVTEALSLVWVLLSGGGIVEILVVQLSVRSAIALVKYYFVGRLLTATQRPTLGFHRSSWQSVKHYSLWNCLNDLVTEGTAQLDKLIIPIVLTVTLVTPYSLIVTIAAVLFVAAEPITDTFLPKFSRRSQRPTRAALATAMTRGTRLVMFPTLVILTLLLVFGETYLDWWVGAQYTEVDYRVIWMVSLSFAFSCYLWTPINVLMACGRVRWIFYASIAEIGLIVALLWLWVPRLGLVGFVFATLTANVLTGIALFIPAACRDARVAVWPYLLSTLLAPVAAIAPLAIVGFWLFYPGNEMSLPVLLTCSAAMGLSAVVCLYVFATPKRERLRYRVLCRQLLGRANA